MYKLGQPCSDCEWLEPGRTLICLDWLLMGACRGRVGSGLGGVYISRLSWVQYDVFRLLIWPYKWRGNTGRDLSTPRTQDINLKGRPARVWTRSVLFISMYMRSGNKRLSYSIGEIFDGCTIFCCPWGRYNVFLDKDDRRRNSREIETPGWKWACNSWPVAEAVHKLCKMEK